ncbi:MAG TPA: hypothetical protein VGH81_09230 [Rudaea sp.]|jgi:hypothetical protein
MRMALYFLATLIVLPYILLSVGFVLLGQAISGGTLFAFFNALLTAALWLVPWGMLAFVLAFVVLLALGASERWRWLGAACLCFAALASLVVILYLAVSQFDLSQLLFLLPCGLVMVFGGWLALSDWRGPRRAA